MSGLIKAIGEAFVDPGSGQGSMSRLGIGVLVGAFSTFMVMLAEGRLNIEAAKIIADVFKWAFPSVALVYGVNSAITAWRRPRGGENHGQEGEEGQVKG